MFHGRIRINPQLEEANGHLRSERSKFIFKNLYVSASE